MVPALNHPITNACDLEKYPPDEMTLVHIAYACNASKTMKANEARKKNWRAMETILHVSGQSVLSLSVSMKMWAIRRAISVFIWRNRSMEKSLENLCYKKFLPKAV